MGTRDAFRVVRHRFGAGPSSARSFDVSPEDRVRFRKRVKVGKPTACWLWRGLVNRGGYGTLMVVIDGGQRPVGAHRIAYRIANGPIPHGMSVRHSCDTPLCVNPSHLVLGTHADNMRDMHERGRAANGWATAVPKAECKEGHVLGAFNRSMLREGCRFCFMLRKAEDDAYAQAEFFAWSATHLQPALPGTYDDLVARIGERDAAALACWSGAFDHAMMTLESVGAMLGVTRERARQLRDRALMKLGVEQPAPFARRRSADSAA